MFRVGQVAGALLLDVLAGVLIVCCGDFRIHVLLGVPSSLAVLQHLWTVSVSEICHKYWIPHRAAMKTSENGL